MHSSLLLLAPSMHHLYGGFPGGIKAKESVCQCRRYKRCSFNPWVGKIPWRRKWQPTPVLLLGQSHGLRSLAGYSPWGCKESDTTEQAHASSNQEIILVICYFLNTSSHAKDRMGNKAWLVSALGEHRIL